MDEVCSPNGPNTDVDKSFPSWFEKCMDQAPAWMKGLFPEVLQVDKWKKKNWNLNPHPENKMRYKVLNLNFPLRWVDANKQGAEKNTHIKVKTLMKEGGLDPRGSYHWKSELKRRQQRTVVSCHHLAWIHGGAGDQRTGTWIPLLTPLMKNKINF